MREIDRVLTGETALDGAGVRLTRIIGSRELNMFDPFLLLDVFASDDPDDYIAGFPPHPHRGFETFTWLLEGRMRHADNAGNGGVIETGGAQWMNAGRGIVHSEMPEQQDGLLRGVQLWINRPAKQKMVAPAYVDLDTDNIPARDEQGASVRIMAGPGAPVHDTPVDLTLLDVSLPAGASWGAVAPADYSVMVWVADGALVIGDRSAGLQAGQLGLLTAGDNVRVTASAAARFLFASARPIGEPVARGGPFVMNTREEIQQAFRDFESGALAGDFYIPGR